MGGGSVLVWSIDVNWFPTRISSSENFLAKSVDQRDKGRR